MFWIGVYALLAFTFAVAVGVYDLLDGEDAVGAIIASLIALIVAGLAGGVLLFGFAALTGALG